MEEIIYKNLSLGLLVVVILFSLLLICEDIFKNKVYYKFEWILVIIFGMIYALYFTYRPILKYSDTEVYINQYRNEISSLRSVFSQSKDFFFYLYSFLSKKIFNNDRFYFFSIVVLFLGPLLLFIKKVNLRHPFIFFAFFVMSFFFESLGGNIIRQGIGLSCFLIGTAFFETERKKAFLLFTIGCLFHISVIIPVLFFIIAVFYRNLNFYIFIYLLTSIIAIANLNIVDFFKEIPLLGSVFSERAIGNGDGAIIYKIGFRPDFYLFNTLFMVIFWQVSRKINFKSLDDYETNLSYFFTYILLSSFFFLMFSQVYSDRYGVMSWIIIPVLIIPFLKSFRRKVGIWNITTLFLLTALISLFFKLR
ncbi:MULTISPECIES: EpsG family protein [unclassified Empedobacter]|uniref:EpsG family protein n=1 Tax=unclassified Empedobacter TaxID=2643773 RepID=UPI0024495637|nr:MULTISPECIES: EpsG family protein [unclassified Empedobacter]MDH2207307.1 EpsG family protein [Empedobacter sp. GD03644]